MKLFSLSLVTTWCIMLISCVSYEPVELISVDDAELVSLAPEGAEINIDATIFNPNDYNIKIESKDLHIFLNDNELGIANFKKPVTLEKSSKKQYQLQVVSSVPADGNIDLGMIAIAGLSGNFEIRAEGKVRATAKGISKDIPVSFKEKL